MHLEKDLKVFWVGTKFNWPLIGFAKVEWFGPKYNAL